MQSMARQLMIRILLLLICAILSGGQAAVAAIVTNDSPVNTSHTIRYGYASFDRTLPAGSLGAQDCWVEGISMYVHDYGIDEVNRLAKNGVLIGDDSQDTYVNLKQGNILLNPDQDVLVATNESKISIGCGAGVFIMQSDNGLIVYDISQASAQQVAITVNNQVIYLTPGCMFVLPKQNTNDFEKLNLNCHAVAYSKVQTLELGNNAINGFLANFSLSSAFTTIEPLRRLTISHNKRDKIALQSLIKNSASPRDIVWAKADNDNFDNADGRPSKIADQNL